MGTVLLLILAVCVTVFTIVYSGLLLFFYLLRRRIRQVAAKIDNDDSNDRGTRP